MERREALVDTTRWIQLLWENPENRGYNGCLYYNVKVSDTYISIRTIYINRTYTHEHTNTHTHTDTHCVAT